jgi:hypothetical protein
MRQILRIVDDYADEKQIDPSEVTCVDIQTDIQIELGLCQAQKHLKVLIYLLIYGF